MSGPEAVYGQLELASSEVRDAAGQLHEERAAVDQAFRSCVGGDWTGAAASSFLPVFEDWNAGLGDVQEGLAAMAELIDAAKRDFAETDDGVRGHMDTIASRIVDRLGG